MSHTCKAAIVHCIDFRLQKAVREYLERQGLLGDCDVVSIAGAVKDWDYAKKQVETSRRLHNIQKLILMSHTDCGAYGGDDSLHAGDLKKAKESTLAKFPDMEVETVLAKIDGSNINFVEV